MTTQQQQRLEAYRRELVRAKRQRDWLRAAISPLSPAELHVLQLREARRAH